MIFYRRGSASKPGRAPRDDRSHASHPAGDPSVPDPERQPRHGVPAPGGGQRRRPRADGADRPAVPDPALLWLAADGGLAEHTRTRGEPQAGAAADAPDGVGGDLPASQHQQGRGGAHQVSLSAQWPDDRPRQPGVVLGHHLYSDAPGLSVPGGDHGCRAVLSWRLSNTLHADFCVEALEEALRGFGQPEIFNTDQGSQFTSDDFIGVLKKSQIKISMDGKGRCMDNVFVERLWRSLKYEEVYLHAYASVSEAKSGIGAWLHFYNEERPHQTHDYRTPRQVYEAQYRWICGRSASPTGCAFDHMPTGTTISKGFNNDGSKGIVTVAAPP